MTQSTLLQLKWNNTLALLKLHNKEGKKSEEMTNPKAAQKIIKIMKNRSSVNMFVLFNSQSINISNDKTWLSNSELFIT